MHDLVTVFGSHAVLRILWAFLSVGTVAGSLLVLGSWLLCRVSFRGLPARAHAVWILTLAGLLALPVVWLAAPPIQLAPAVRHGAILEGAPAGDLGVPSVSVDRLLGLTGTAGGYAALARQSVPGRIPVAGWVLLAAWATGAGALLLRVAAGQVVARRNARGAALPKALGRVAREVCRGLSLRRTVRFRASPRCAVPYTFGFLHPLVVLPVEAEQWPAARLRAVLLHELAHVRRADSLTGLLATLVNAVLWCCPPVWMAVSFLARSGELACDRLVVAHGVAAPRYASEMLELARSYRGSLFVPAELSSFGSGVRERIEAVLKAGPRRLAMAPRAILSAAAVFCCLLALLAGIRAAAPGADPLFGAWTNPQYFDTYWTHTFVISPGDRWTWFDRTDVEQPTCDGRYVIERAWTGSDSSRWYHLTTKSSYYSYNEEVGRATLTYYLAKVDRGGDRIDIEASLLTWPESFGALGNYHYVYYRKE